MRRRDKCLPLDVAIVLISLVIDFWLFSISAPGWVDFGAIILEFVFGGLLIKSCHEAQRLNNVNVT